MFLYKFINLAFVLFTLSTNAHEPTNNVSLVYSFYRFKVCGAYCGPGWCNNMWLDEDKCDTSVEPEHHKLTGDSCADSCCKHHDKCCGQEKILQKICNKEIVNCLSKCDPLSLTCTFDNIPIITGSIELAMNIVEKWCCGTFCP